MSEPDFFSFKIDYSNDPLDLPKFWNSTGFTPATLFLTQDMEQQIILLGSLPGNGLKFVRVHFLLELISVTFDGEFASSYDWSRLDYAMDLLYKHNLVPIFEIMGNPDGQFTSFKNDLQLKRWKNMTRDLANHYMERYGNQEVEEWYFETWNEPDIGWWHEFPHDEEAFNNYYDACIQGLKSANPNLVMGGPGTCVTISSLFKSFLNHCYSGSDYFSGEPAIKPDFISIHEKAARANKEDLTPKTLAMVNREVQIYNYIKDEFPQFSKLPFMNNECDPQVGWKDHHTWHARSYYAAWMVKSVWLHLKYMIDDLNCNYSILSNDNGFIGTWGNRTLFTRFGDEKWIEDGQSRHQEKQAWDQRDFTTPTFSLVKKPAFNALVLLGLLGKNRIPYSWDDKSLGLWTESDVNIIPTMIDRGNVAILVYANRDNINTSGTKEVKLEIKNLPFEVKNFIQLSIQENHGDPFVLWEAAGAPKYPSQTLLHEIRYESSKLIKTNSIRIKIEKNEVTIVANHPMHSVSLYVISGGHHPPPQKPSMEVNYKQFQSVNNRPEYLIFWKPNQTNGINTFNILYADENNKPFKKLDLPPHFNSAAFVEKQGLYKIQTCDLWGEVLAESPILQIT